MRRLLALLFCALLLCAPAGAETFAVNAGENALLVTDAGKALTAWGEYAAASRVSPPECPPERALFIAAPVLSALPEGMEEGDLARYRLLNARGEALGDELYSSARHLPEAGVVVVWQGEWTGVIGEDGEKILPCACGGVLPDGEGGFLVTPREYFNCDADGYAISARLWRIDPDGAAADTGLTVQPQFSAEFADGLAPLCVSTAEGWRYGYANARGELAIPAAFDYAEDFRDGYAAARTLSGGMGLLRPDGSWALEPVYSELGYLWGDGAAFYALREGSVELIDRETLRVRAAFDVSHADYAYAYELDGAAIVIVAGGEMLAVDMEGNVLFRGDAADYVQLMQAVGDDHAAAPGGAQVRLRAGGSGEVDEIRRHAPLPGGVHLAQAGGVGTDALGEHRVQHPASGVAFHGVEELSAGKVVLQTMDGV